MCRVGETCMTAGFCEEPDALLIELHERVYWPEADSRNEEKHVSLSCSHTFGADGHIYFLVYIRAHGAGEKIVGLASISFFVYTVYGVMELPVAPITKGNFAATLDVPFSVVRQSYGC